MAELPPPAADQLRSSEDVPVAAALPIPVAPRGWYPDPHGAPRERWWDGEAWTDVTHRRAKAGLYSAEYQRSLWAGANRLAGVARWVNLAALVLMLAGLFSLLATEGSKATMLALVVTGFLLAIAGLVLALIALARSERLGAKALAVYQVVAAPLAIFMGLIVLTATAAL